MEDAATSTTETVAGLQETLAHTVLLELELGITFLDIAETTADREHARVSVGHATTALRTADKFLAQIVPGTINLDAIWPRRALLTERLRAISGADKTRRE